jgi:hypothetical protein
MESATPEEIKRALELVAYKKQYYKEYQQKDSNKLKRNKTQKEYLERVYKDEDKHKALRERQKLYYKNVVAPKRALEKKKKQEALLNQ